MITFLWMLYLAFTLFFTIITIFDICQEIFEGTSFRVFNIIIISILWSIWYFYFLN